MRQLDFLFSVALAVIMFSHLDKPTDIIIMRATRCFLHLNCRTVSACDNASPNISQGMWNVTTNRSRFHVACVQC